MNAVDTNVLIYVNDPQVLRKQAIAAQVVKDLDAGVSIQLSEYPNAFSTISASIRSRSVHDGNFKIAPVSALVAIAA